MRGPLLALLFTASTLTFGCGGTSTPKEDFATAPSTDMATSSGTQTLTVNNTLSWCSVVVTVGSAAAVTFTGASMSFQAAAGTTVTLSATPLPTFEAVQWTGTTTMSGADATYVMTSASAQSITACCPESNGSGC